VLLRFALLQFIISNMITPGLEKLILCGKAFFKTFVAGGDKHTLTFGNDRFIIITDITYFPMNIITNDGSIFYKNSNTQVAIYGERGYNHYIFRNYNNALTQSQDPDVKDLISQDYCSPVTINTYLLHEQQVGFSFCNAPYFTNQFNGGANADNPGYKQPIEWGIDPYGFNVALSIQDPTTNLQTNFTIRPAAGNSESQQLMFPFRPEFSFGFNGGGGDGLSNKLDYPLLLVNYVEIIGSPNNISI